MDIKNLRFSAEEIDRLLTKIRDIDGSDIGTSADIDLTIGRVETVDSAEEASASIVRNGDSYKLNLSIPRGEKGLSGDSDLIPTFTIGTITTEDTPQVNLKGDPPNYVMNFVFPTSTGEGSTDIPTEIETKVTTLENTVSTLDNTVSTLQILNDLKINYSYIMATFDNTDMKLNILGSKDGVEFNVLYRNCYCPKLGNKSLRDPSIMYHN